MFYVLFTYSKGNKERDFRGFRSEDDLIDFLHLEYERIDIVQIISVERSYRLGLIETEDLIKSVLVRDKESLELKDPEEDTDPVPFPDPGEEKIGKTGEKMEETEPGEPLTGEKSGMEKIADDIEKEMSEEEIIKKNKEALKRADNAIAAAKEDIEKTGQKFDKTKWKDCPICQKEKVAPWSKKGICSICQRNKKKLRKKEEEI